MSTKSTCRAGSAGFLQNPKREEQRVTEAYEAGYADGEEKNTGNFSNWAKS